MVYKTYYYFYFCVDKWQSMYDPQPSYHPPSSFGDALVGSPVFKAGSSQNLAGNTNKKI